MMFDFVTPGGATKMSNKWSSDISLLQKAFYAQSKIASTFTPYFADN